VSEDTPRFKDGSVLTPEQVDNEPSYITPEDLSGAYDEEFEADMDDLVKELQK
jgi:hypothetical protein